MSEYNEKTREIVEKAKEEGDDITKVLPNHFKKDNCEVCGKEVTVAIISPTQKQPTCMECKNKKTKGEE